MDSLFEINWIGSSIAAIVLSIVSNLLTPRVKDWVAQWSSSRTRKRIGQLERELQQLNALTMDPHQFTHYLLKEGLGLTVGLALGGVGISTTIVVGNAHLMSLITANSGSDLLFVLFGATVFLTFFVFTSTIFNAFRLFSRLADLNGAAALVNARLDRLRSNRI